MESFKLTELLPVGFSRTSLIVFCTRHAACYVKSRVLRSIDHWDAFGNGFSTNSGTLLGTDRRRRTSYDRWKQHGRKRILARHRRRGEVSDMQSVFFQSVLNGIRIVNRVSWLAAATASLFVACGNDSDTPVDGQYAGWPGSAISGYAGSVGMGGSLSVIAGTGGMQAITPIKTNTAGSTAPTAGRGGGAAGKAGASGTTSAAAGTSTAGASGAAGAAGKAGQNSGAVTGDDPCGPDAKTVTGTPRKGESGFIEIDASGDNQVLSVTTTMTVPSNPQPQQGTLFIWPGLQPADMNDPRGYGVLQPVLTWGSSCAPGSLMSNDTWWISAQYVGSPAGAIYSNIKCEGGEVIKVKAGDKLDIEMVLNGTVWTQTVTNQSNNTSGDFDKDLKGQEETRILFYIELPSGGFGPKPVDDVIFTSTVIKFSKSAQNDCVPITKGPTDYFSPPRVSTDGKTCCLSKIILRASGAKASSPDEP
jgi:hypothetical protein